MFSVTVSEKGGQQSTYDFNKLDITIGRMKGNDIVLPKGNVSKRHSRIFHQNGGAMIEDCGSTNGTYVNGRKISGQQSVGHEDKIYIGDFIIQLQPERSASKRPPPAPRAQVATGIGSGATQEASMSGVPPAVAATGTVPPPGPARRSTTPGKMSFEDAQLPTADQTLRAEEEESEPVVAPRPTSPPVATSRRDFRPQRSSSNDADREPVSAVLEAANIPSEFDPEFHTAQFDVARVLFESISASDLPLNYPPTPGDVERLTAKINQAIGRVNPRVDRDELLQLLIHECCRLGPLEGYLDDPEVQDVYINRYDQVLLRKNGKLTAAKRTFSHPDLLLSTAYRLIGPRTEAVHCDEVRFNDGTKVHVILPPLAVDGPAITVRKPPMTHYTLEQLVQHDVLSDAMAEFLTRASESGRSILVAGPANSGKTTLLSALTAKLPAGVRTASVEERAVLKLPFNAVRTEVNAALGYGAAQLLRAALSIHPERIILDECRGGEAYDWVTGAACGTSGSMITLHGTSSSDALGRLENLCMLGGGSANPRAVREQIARAVDIVVVIHRVREQSVRVQQITEVQGVDLDSFRTNDIFYYRITGTGGAFHPTGYIPLFYEDLKNTGIDVDFGIFQE